MNTMLTDMTAQAADNAYQQEDLITEADRGRWAAQDAEKVRQCRLAQEAMTWRVIAICALVVGAAAVSAVLEVSKASVSHVAFLCFLAMGGLIACAGSLCAAHAKDVEADQ